jgi:hypothetical protein
MTAPLVPIEVDLRDFHFMPLDVSRLVNSDLAAIASGEEFKAAVILWCKSWHQIPASSLPNDDRMLAHLAGYGRDTKAWSKVREIALKGFVLCSDGRLYHPVVAEKAMEAWAERLSYQRRKEEFSERQKARVSKRWEKKRAANDTETYASVHADDDTARITGDDTARITEKIPMKGTGTGTGTGIKDDGKTRARDSTESFEDTEKALYAVPELNTQPVRVNAVIAPIWKLVQQGYDLQTQVIPSVRRQARTATRPIKSWAYFVDGIVQDAAPTVTPKPFAGDRPHGFPRQNSAAQQLRDAIAEVKSSLADCDPAA